MVKNNKKYSTNTPYTSHLTRRDTLKWLGLLSSSAAVPAFAALSNGKRSTAVMHPNWPNLRLEPISAKGYGKDPNLILPPKSAWPRTLDKDQLTLIAVMSDIIVPSDGDAPSATEVNVPDVVDEWLSAPYAWQQSDRVSILNLLAWLDDESARRFHVKFVDGKDSQQKLIVDDIAFKTAYQSELYKLPAQAFAKLRRLVMAAYFCSPQGTKDIGYLGNVPIAGDYPGPTKEAYEHLDSVLKDLGLTL